MKIKLVTDSTCDLPANWLKKYDIDVVPATIRFGDEVFLDRVTITPSQFYERIKQGEFPSTSQPTIGQFVDIYERLAPEADHILSVHVGSKLSGTYQSAVAAAQRVTHGAKIWSIDSQSGSGVLGWMLLHAAALIRNGHGPEEIMAKINKSRAQSTIYFAVDDLNFARRSGRVNRFTGLLASTLRIKPVIGWEAGEISVKDKTRNMTQALNKILDRTEQQVGQKTVNISSLHAANPGSSQTLFNGAMTRLIVANGLEKNLGLSVATHFGPGTVGLVTYPTF